MAARPKSIVMLAEDFDWSIDPKGLLMSEKLDGRRATWRDGRLVSRYGNRIAAPAWFVDALKALPQDFGLDGELWLGRNTYETLSGVVTVATHRLWKDMAYVCFDRPGHPAPFAERLRMVEKAVSGLGVPHVRYLPHVVCEGQAHVRESLDRIVAAGGEGLMFRTPGGAYVEGREENMLKLPHRFTTEAEVIGYEESRKMRGLVGALICRLPNGVIFEVGTGLTMVQRGMARPPVGSEITFSYKGLMQSGIPREPSFIAVRTMPRKPGPAKTRGSRRAREARAG